MTDALAELQQRYKTTATSTKSTTRAAFDQRVELGKTAGLERIARDTTVTRDNPQLTQIATEYARLKLEMAQTTLQYKSLVGGFIELLKQDPGLLRGGFIKLLYAVGMTERAKKMELDLVEKKGIGIEVIVGKMAEILTENHEKAKERIGLIRGLITQNRKHGQYLQDEHLKALRSGLESNYSTVEVDQRVSQYKTDLKTIDDQIESYRQTGLEARSGSDKTALRTATDSLQQAYTLKNTIVEKMGLDQDEGRRIRQGSMDSAKAIEMSQGAYQQHMVLDATLNSMLDANIEYEITYRHTRNMMIPLFRMQGTVAAMGEETLDMRNALVDVAHASEDIMELNAKAALAFESDALDLLENPIYDPERAARVYNDMTAVQEQLQKRKDAFADTLEKIGKDAGVTYNPLA